jgi:thiamine-monophosphate kinase
VRFQEWGEDNFIQHLADRFAVQGSVVGIGDDCAVIPLSSKESWLVTTDALVERVHFLREQIAPQDLGYKALAVNVSDIAAMGGQPKYVFLSLALPKTLEAAWACEFLEGLESACRKWGVQLLGGDTVGSHSDLFINLTLIGAAETANIRYRYQAKVGDHICVTGHLGEAGAGFKVLQAGLLRKGDRDLLCRAHQRPEPSPEQGSWLARQAGVHAMMDLSDGLACDLKRLLKSSKKGAQIEIERLPISDQLARVCAENGWDPLQQALTGGEDYCLLVTLAAEACAELQRAFQQKFGGQLFDIGTITEVWGKLVYLKQGKEVEVPYAAFNHFG